MLEERPTATLAGLTDQTALGMWGTRLRQAPANRKKQSFVQMLTKAASKDDPGLWGLRLKQLGGLSLGKLIQKYNYKIRFGRDS